MNAHKRKQTQTNADKRKIKELRPLLRTPFLRQPKNQQERVYPYPLGAGSARPNPKIGAPDPENPLFLGFSVRREGLRPWSQTMVSEGARPWGRCRSGNCEKRKGLQMGLWRLRACLETILRTLRNLRAGRPGETCSRPYGFRPQGSLSQGQNPNFTGPLAETPKKVLTLTRERQRGGQKRGGGGKTSRGDPPQFPTPLTSVRFAPPPPPHAISLSKSHRNFQNFPQLTSSETVFGGSQKIVSDGPSSRGFAFRYV